MKQAVPFILFVAFSAFACNSQQEPPENLIDEDTYVNLLIEMQLLETYSLGGYIDSVAADSLLNQVLKKYNVTEEQFSKSHRYYQNNIEKQTARIDTAIERLRKDRISWPDSISADSVESVKNQRSNNKL